MAMETIRKTEPMTNTSHNLVQLLSTKLDSAARYELYKKDAKEDGDQDLVGLLDTLHHDDMQHVHLLRDAIAGRVKSDKFT